MQDLLKINNGRAFVYERLEVTLFKDLQTLKLKVFQRFSILFQRVALAETSNSEHIEVPIAVHIVVTIQPWWAPRLRSCQKEVSNCELQWKIISQTWMVPFFASFPRLISIETFNLMLELLVIPLTSTNGCSASNGSIIECSKRGRASLVALAPSSSPFVRTPSKIFTARAHLSTLPDVK